MGGSGVGRLWDNGHRGSEGAEVEGGEELRQRECVREIYGVLGVIGCIHISLMFTIRLA